MVPHARTPKKEDDPHRPCKCRTLLFLWNNQDTTMDKLLRSTPKKLKKVDSKAWRYPFPSLFYFHDEDDLWLRHQDPDQPHRRSTQGDQDHGIQRQSFGNEWTAVLTPSTASHSHQGYQHPHESWWFHLWRCSSLDWLELDQVKLFDTNPNLV